jgi:hypothetical protein
MWYKLDKYLAPLFNVCGSLDREEWIVVMATSVVIGYFFLRGFGSRANY